jgi:hypothetical protein
VFNVEPKPAEMLAIQRSIFHEANLRVGRSFDEPGEALFQATAAHNPRFLSRLWDIALGFACAAGRRHLVSEDIRGAEQVLLGGKESARRPIGFVRPRSKEELGRG